MPQTYPHVAGVELVGYHPQAAPNADWTQFAHKLPDCSGKRVLILNAGSGWFARQAVLAGAIAVLGVDSQAKNVNLARASGQSSRLRFRLMPTSSWPILGGFYDMIIVAGVDRHNFELLADLSHLLRHNHGTIAMFGGEEDVQKAESHVFSSDHQPGSWSASALTRLPSGAVASVLRRRRLGGHH